MNLLGSPDEPWPLARAVDALVAAAARAGVPGLVWLPGILYPSLSISLDLAHGLIGAMERMTGVDLPGGGSPGALLGALGLGQVELGSDSSDVILVLLPLLFLYRLVAGLAFVSDPEVEASGALAAGGGGEPGVHRRAVPLRTVWRAGKGLGASAMGLWLVLLVLLGGATALLLGLPALLARLVAPEVVQPLVVALLLPALLVLLAYALLLEIANQLALHSLAHNRRGAASALAHAWRLMRGAPASVARAALLDAALLGAALLVARSLTSLFAAHAAGLGQLLVLVLLGFVGVARAGFWARGYRALGGLSTLGWSEALGPGAAARG